MPRLAISIGLMLMGTGLIGYFGTGRESPTALIPAFFGLIMGGLGLLASWRPGARRHAMHAATAVAVLGFVGSVQGIPGFFTLLAGGDVERPWAAVAQAVMAVLTAVFVAAAVRSFVIARQSRATDAE